MAASLELDAAFLRSDAFARFFSGDIDVANGEPAAATSAPAADTGGLRGWATPYAVSVFGQPIMAPDPFGRGNGYGDGRAISLGEVLTSAGARWELQLKGGGTTPFSRGGDGRAVLRSSVREFLVSEAMDALGVPTTRALSLVASRSQYVRRMWYAEDDRGRDHPPDTMVSERCAITCRAAPSFLRVGHVELHSRRLMRPAGPGETPQDEARAQLEALLAHAIRREFAAEVDAAAPLAERCLQLLRAFVERQAALAVHWLRVGYVQGNMNSDNCLLSGRTMDYGPFGFVEEYTPLWSPFTSDMERKFGFERQPVAAQVNVLTLARALVPLLGEGDEEAIDKLQSLVQDGYKASVEGKLAEMRRAKLGLSIWDEEARTALWPQLSALMAKSRVDYTILFRQLSYFSSADICADDASERLLKKLQCAFYCEAAAAEARDEWLSWIALYTARLQADGRGDAERMAEMQATSPKYIPREWMLVHAYEAAERGDTSVLEELLALFTQPFDEQPHLEEKYYRTTPPEFRKKAGVAFFS
uniref:Selenoprotein O n=1 Tax=Calcidiscus leptoporus TaxID=127549 RepID=A0A7S0IW07_9EUKA